MHANASQLVLVVLLIGWKSGANLSSHSSGVESAKPITFRHSSENRSISNDHHHSFLTPFTAFLWPIWQRNIVYKERTQRTRNTQRISFPTLFECLIFNCLFFLAAWNYEPVFRGVCGKQTHSILHPGAAGRSLVLRGRLGYLPMNKHLMTGPRETMSIVSLKPPTFPVAKPRETLRSRGIKTRCFVGDQSLSVLLYLPTQN